jgi:prepilin-type N-terminal cleavage/methylation domain-containing protein
MFIRLRHGCERGVTLSEMSVAIAVSGIILTALLSFTVYAAKSFVAIENYVDLEQKSQNALDTMTRDIRETQCLSNYTTRVVAGQTVTNSLTFHDFDNQALTFIFTNNALQRIKGSDSTMLLTNVDYLSFQIFQRNPVPGQWEQYPAGDVATCKLISVSWICSRSILGSRMNTESVQTAKIVIRKQ